MLEIDFLSKSLRYRVSHASLRVEAIARALGLKKHVTSTIVDATAGLGRDSLIIAALGFNVIMLERSPMIHDLLAAAMQRAAEDEKMGPIIQRMQLIHADAMTWLPEHSPDLIYLDPMFPERKKAALNKKNMRLFNEIVGYDADAAQLLAVSLACAIKRVVVKRPRLSSELGDRKPHHTLIGASNRFDVYLL